MYDYFCGWWKIDTGIAYIPTFYFLFPSISFILCIFIVTVIKKGQFLETENWNCHEIISFAILGLKICIISVKQMPYFIVVLFPLAPSLILTWPKKMFWIIVLIFFSSALYFFSLFLIEIVTKTIMRPCEIYEQRRPVAVFLSTMTALFSGFYLWTNILQRYS